MLSRAWMMFWVVALIWGSSFLLIRVGVGEMSPSQVVLIRCAVAAVGLNLVLYATGRRLPTDRATWRILTFIGIGNATVPYLLLGLGEQSIPSSVASVLQSTTALFAMVMAHFAIHDERMTVSKVAGILLGFIGVVVLASRQHGAEDEATASLIGALCVVGASFSYASLTTYSRRVSRGKIEPLVISAASFLVATLGAAVAVVLEPLLGGRAWTPLHTLSSDVMIAVLILGVLNTFVAYLFYYYIVQELGASRATMVTYVVPVVGLILGWLVLNEPIDITLILGAALIMSGIAMATVGVDRLRARFSPRVTG